MIKTIERVFYFQIYIQCLLHANYWAHSGNQQNWPLASGALESSRLEREKEGKKNEDDDG